MLICTERIVLIKDSLNKKILLKFFNHLDFNKDFKDFQNDRIFIINDYNLESIDLERSNIKKKPAKIFYSFTDIYLENYND